VAPSSSASAPTTSVRTVGGRGVVVVMVLQGRCAGTAHGGREVTGSPPREVRRGGTSEGRRGPQGRRGRSGATRVGEVGPFDDGRVRRAGSVPRGISASGGTTTHERAGAPTHAHGRARREKLPGTRVHGHGVPPARGVAPRYRPGHQVVPPTRRRYARPVEDPTPGTGAFRGVECRRLRVSFRGPQRGELL